MTVIEGVVPDTFPVPTSDPVTAPAPDEPEVPEPPPTPSPPDFGVLVTAQSGASAGHAGALPPETAHGWQVKPREHSRSEVQVVGEAASTRPTNARELKATEA